MNKILEEIKKKENEQTLNFQKIINEIETNIINNLIQIMKNITEQFENNDNIIQNNKKEIIDQTKLLLEDNKKIINNTIENQFIKINENIKKINVNDVSNFIQKLNKEEINTIKLLFVNCEKNLYDKFTQTWENLRIEIAPLIKRNKLKIIEEEKRKKEE